MKTLMATVVVVGSLAGGAALAMEGALQSGGPRLVTIATEQQESRPDTSLPHRGAATVPRTDGRDTSTTRPRRTTKASSVPPRRDLAQDVNTTKQSSPAVRDSSVLTLEPSALRPQRVAPQEPSSSRASSTLPFFIAPEVLRLIDQLTRDAEASPFAGSRRNADRSATQAQTGEDALDTSVDASSEDPRRLSPDRLGFDRSAEGPAYQQHFATPPDRGGSFRGY